MKQKAVVRRKRRGSGALRRKRAGAAVHPRRRKAGAAAAAPRGRRRRRASRRLRKRRPARLMRRAAGELTPPAAASPPPILEGFNRGFEQGHAAGYRDGLYEGGEAVVERHLPEAHILPEVSAEQVIASGVGLFADRLLPLRGTAEIAAQLQDAIAGRRPFSVIRLGDGELLAMAQGAVLPAEQVAQLGPFLGYAGIQVPDYAARDQLVEAVRQASVVGIPTSRKRTYQPLAFEVFRHFGLDYRSLPVTSSTINYSLYMEQHLPAILAGRRILLIGNKAPALRAVLVPLGYHIVEAVAPVQGMRDVPRVLEAARVCDFDVALVSAGIAAVPIASRLAAETGRVAVDFGHLADSIVSGEATLPSVG